uniref:pyruvate decarboxylase n=1 Tax=Oryza rufipogon TaxID=4529 RepID=A0A0E0MYD9_ORYRU
METTGGGGSPKEAVVPSAASGDTTLGRHLAHRLVGISDVFAVPGDLNLTLLNHLISPSPASTSSAAATSSTLASYAADGYARARGVGACAVTFTVRGQLLHGCRHRSHRFWNQVMGDEARKQAPPLGIRSARARLRPRRSGSVVVGGGSASPSSPPSPSSETTAFWDRHGATAALLPRRACRAHCIGNALPFSRVVVAEQRLACSVGQEEKSERETRKGEDGEERGG